jgi:hypothetical protein
VVQILHNPEQPSSPGKGIKCKAYPRRGERSKEGMKIFPTCETGIKGSPKRFSNHSNVFLNQGKNGIVAPNLWSMYPCVFCGFNNHCMEKCWKRQSLQENSSKKEEKRKGLFPK